jgi:hypothetical protein
MKNIIWTFFLLGLLSSCATIKSLPEGNLDQLVASILAGPSKVDPIELTLSTDFPRDHVDLVKTYSASTNRNTGVTSSSDSGASLLGFYFGNGLYYDRYGNLVIRLDKIAGIKEDFVGDTLFKGYVFSGAGASPMEKRATFTKGSVDIKIKGVLLADHKIEFDNKKASGNGETVYFEPQKTKVAPTFFIPLQSKEYVWEKIANGYRVSWDLFNNNEYYLIDGKISDKEKTFTVENNGNYLRFAFTKGNKYAYRIYRTAEKVLVLDESSGGSVLIQKEGQKYSWRSLEQNWAGATDKLLDYSYEVFPVGN